MHPLPSSPASSKIPRGYIWKNSLDDICKGLWDNLWWDVDTPPSIYKSL